jgi:hypothetical protein
MNRVLSTMCCLALSAALVSPVMAEHHHIKKREQREGNRINKGTQRGQLTTKERNRLLNQQGDIDLERRQAMADGKMTKRERQDIRHDQNRLSHDIYNKRHNKKRAH